MFNDVATSTTIHTQTRLSVLIYGSLAPLSGVCCTCIIGVLFCHIRRSFCMIFSVYPLQIFLYKPSRPKGLFQFEIIMNVLASYFRFIWIHIFNMYIYIHSVSAGIVSIHQNLTSAAVRFWRIKGLSDPPLQVTENYVGLWNLRFDL